MTKETPQNEATLRPTVLTLRGMDSVEVRRDIPYGEREDSSLTFDLYPPPEASGERSPAVVLVTGYPDPGFEATLGCKQKEMASYGSWGRLLATMGLTAVTYSNNDPARDLDRLLRVLRRDADSLGIDVSRMGVWACSGCVPLALSLLVRTSAHRFACAALCYGYMLDGEEGNEVAEAAATYHFMNPGKGDVTDLPDELPLLVVRAGDDAMPGLNASIDRFLARAVRHDLSLTFVNHHSAPHAFDIVDDIEASRLVIRQILDFFRLHLLE